MPKKQPKKEPEQLEVRIVPRASVADEIGEGANADPFKRVREAMKANETEH